MARRHDTSKARGTHSARLASYASETYSTERVVTGGKADTDGRAEMVRTFAAYSLIVIEVIYYEKTARELAKSEPRRARHWLIESRSPGRLGQTLPFLPGSASTGNAFDVLAITFANTTHKETYIETLSHIPIAWPQTRIIRVSLARSTSTSSSS